MFPRQRPVVKARGRHVLVRPRRAHASARGLSATRGFPRATREVEQKRWCLVLDRMLLRDSIYRPLCFRNKVFGEEVYSFPEWDGQMSNRFVGHYDGLPKKCLKSMNSGRT